MIYKEEAKLSQEISAAIDKAVKRGDIGLLSVTRVLAQINFAIMEAINNMGKSGNNPTDSADWWRKPN